MKTPQLVDRFDWLLFLTVAVVSVMGVANLYSATSPESASKADVYIQQIYWLALGAALAVVVVSIDYRFYERYGYVIYVVGLMLLILVFLLGRNIRGSQRWIPIGAFSFQPSEFMKICLSVAVAKYLHNDVPGQGRSLRDLWTPLGLLTLPMVLILKQPDLGTAMILVFTFISIMLLSRIKLKSMVMLTGVVFVSTPLIWRLLKEYQRDRIRSFLNPTQDVLKSGWHAYQSTVAIGSGGWFGKGFLHGTQNQHRFLPDQHTDFPFPVWAEEWGFVGTTLLLTIYLAWILRGLYIASQARDRFGAALAVGVSAIIFWHTFINIGMVSGVVPVVGVTLPLFSYGGSSVLTVLVGVGLLMNISMRRHYF